MHRHRLVIALLTSISIWSSHSRPCRAEQIQTIFMDGRTYRIPLGFQVVARSPPKNSDAIWLLALWPGLKPFFVDGQKAQNGVEEVTNTVGILIEPINKINDIDKQFLITVRNDKLLEHIVPDYMNDLKPDQTYHGETFIGNTPYPGDAIVYLEGGKVDSFVVCAGLATPDRRPSCHYFFRDTINDFQVSFARKYISNLLEIRRLTTALRDNSIGQLEEAR